MVTFETIQLSGAIDDLELLIIVWYFLVQNTTIDLGNNVTVISRDIRDNPDLEFYALIYGMGIIAMVVFTLLRAFLFMKVWCSFLSFTVPLNVWPLMFLWIQVKLIINITCPLVVYMYMCSTVCQKLRGTCIFHCDWWNIHFYLLCKGDSSCIK